MLFGNSSDYQTTMTDQIYRDFIVCIIIKESPPVCRALDNISLHLSLIESEVPGARGKVLINVLGVTSVGSLLLLELLLELLQEQRVKLN